MCPGGLQTPLHPHTHRALPSGRAQVLVQTWQSCLAGMLALLRLQGHGVLVPIVGVGGVTTGLQGSQRLAAETQGVGQLQRPAFQRGAIPSRREQAGCAPHLQTAGRGTEGSEAAVSVCGGCRHRAAGRGP